MLKFLFAEQIIGTAFFELLNLQKYALNFEQLYSLNHQLSVKLRKEKNTVLCFSSYDIFDIVDNYSEFFELRQEKLLIKTENGNSIVKQNLNDYFLEGLSTDILEYLMENISEILDLR